MTQHAEICNGEIEAHVSYDHKLKVFRAEQRCFCRLVQVVSPNRHSTFLPADAEARSLPAPPSGPIIKGNRKVRDWGQERDKARARAAESDAVRPE